MGRPRGGKAKRAASQAKKNEDADAGSGDEETMIPTYKRRGRPQKHFKADSDEEEDSVKVQAMEDSDGAKPIVPRKDISVEIENGGKKRRRRGPNRCSEPAMEEKDDEPTKQVGFRHHGSRRKSTPRRAAEAGVDCN